MYITYWRQVMFFVYQNTLINFPENISFQMSLLIEGLK